MIFFNIFVTVLTTLLTIKFNNLYKMYKVKRETWVNPVIIENKYLEEDRKSLLRKLE